jgi:hypothetical protein
MKRNGLKNGIKSGLVIGLLTFVCPLVFSQTVKNDLTAEEWREDLKYLVGELEVRHIDLYGNISKADFRRETDKLSAGIPSLTGERVIFEFARLLVLIGDGHTGIFLPFDRESPFRRYPIEVYPAADGWLVIGAAPEYASLIGTKIRRIEQTDVEKAFELLEPVMPRDNTYKLRAFFPQFMIVPEILSAAGVAKNVDELVVTVEDAGGNLRTATLKPVARNAAIDWRFVKPLADLPLWLKRRNEKYWFTFLEDKKAVYVQFNSADIGVGEPEAQFIAFTNDLTKSIETNKAEKLIIDLRWNSGGNTRRTRHLLYSIIKSERINRPGRLFTITSNTTYSAAVWHMLLLEQHTETLFVGTPAGGRPNHSGELRRFRLPKSRWEIRYAAAYDRLSDPGDTRPVIMPHLLTPLSAEDYRNGRDPALDAVFSYQPKQPVADVLRKTLAETGVKAALAQYQELKRSQYNRYDFDIGQLIGLGQELLGAGKTEAAIAVFDLNCAEHPFSAWSFYNLGYAYEQAGKFKPAIENYEKAFALDRRYTQVLDAIRELKKKIN